MDLFRASFRIIITGIQPIVLEGMELVCAMGLHTAESDIRF
jgi:hypothetical protein